ncbi:MAG: galactokinase [Acidobacteria bacterium]|nr:galactokinase [Acidobacteriota bacterium]
MIVTRTPFRVTLGGGGTDLPSYYQDHGGFIFAMGLDKYMYVFLNPRPIDRKVRLLYTKSEMVDDVRELEHELAREGLLLHGIETAIEVASLADLPAGTGVGSSSCYLVGLLNSVRAYRRIPCTPKEVAEEACHLELNVLKKPIGKQDQYMAAFGGLTVLHINPEGVVEVDHVSLSPADLAQLIANTHIYYTGVKRNTIDILSEQNRSLVDRKEEAHQVVSESLHHIKDLGYKILEAIRRCNFDTFGQLLDDHWNYKKRMSSKISTSFIDQLYETVKHEFKVLGGKIIGAGGGGFLMLYCPGNQEKLSKFMESQGLMRLWYSVDFEGSKVVANHFNLGSINVNHSLGAGPGRKFEATHATKAGGI